MDPVTHRLKPVPAVIGDFAKEGELLSVLFTSAPALGWELVRGASGGNPAARDAEHNSVVTARDACRGRGAPIVQPGGKVLGRVLQRLFGGGRDDRRGQRRGTLYDFHELAELLLDFRIHDIARFEGCRSSLVSVAAVGVVWRNLLVVQPR